MDDLTQKLHSLLSDPESMRNLSELAAMLQSESNPDPAPVPQPEAAHANSDSAPPFDFAKLLAVGQALSAVQQDENADLILALKPHLSAERAKRADQAAKMLRLWSAAGILCENGMLSDLFGSDDS